MKEKLEEFALFYGKRRSKKDKVRFMNRMKIRANETGFKMKIFSGNGRRNVGTHFICNKGKDDTILVATNYDTGSKILNPNYCYRPLDARHNFKEEILNVVLYSLMALLVLIAAVMITKNFYGYSFLGKVSVCVSDVIVVGLVFRWTKRPDNKMNINRNTAALSLIADCMEDLNNGSFGFIDQGCESNQGFFEFAEEVGEKSVLLLDCLAKGEEVFLAYHKKNEEKAQLMKEKFPCDIHMIPLNDEEYENTPMADLKNGYMLFSGKWNKGKTCININKVRSSADTETDFRMMEKLGHGLKRVCQIKGVFN